MALRICIDKEWTVGEWMSSLRSISEIYYSYLTPNLLLDVSIEELIKTKAYYLYQDGVGKSDLDRYFMAEKEINEKYGRNPARSEIVESIVTPNKRLSVGSVSFNSPGYQDLTGVGEALKHVKEFILGIIDRIQQKPRRELENKLLQIDIARKYVDLQRERLSLVDSIVDVLDPMREKHYLKRQIYFELIDKSYNDIEKLIEKGKITSVEMIGE